MSTPLPIFAFNMTAYQDAADEAGFNRSTCAKMARMSPAQWANLLNGQRPSPSVWTAVRIAETLRVSVDALLTTDPAEREATAKLVYRTFKRMK